MLDRAKFLVVSEITEVLGEKTPEVEVKVEQALERCFATKARNAARAKAASATRAKAPAARVAALDARRARRPAPGAASATAGHVGAFGGTDASWPRSSRTGVQPAVAVSLYVFLARPARPPLDARHPPARALLYATGACGVRIGLRAGRASAAGRRPRAPANRRASTPATTAATSNRPRCSWRCGRFFPRLRVLYKAELRKLPVLVWAFDVAGFVPLERGEPGPELAGRRPGGRGPARGQFVLHLSRRHAEPDRRAAAVQEGRLRDGDQGAGADRACRGLGRP